MIAQGFSSPEIEWWHLSPLVTLVAGALVLLVVGAMTPRWPRGLYGAVAAATAALSGVFAYLQWRAIDDDGVEIIIGRALAFDHFAQFLTITICAATLLVVLVTVDELHRSGTDNPEAYAMFLVAAAGGVVMASANDLIVLFLGLETLSLALYVLAASDRARRASQESGLKYFVLGGFASAFFLYGIALVYGGSAATVTDSSGRVVTYAPSTNIGDISRVFAETVPIDGDRQLVLAGLALLLVGLGFKVAAVPFHAWAPDVYQGAPTNVTAFMASVGKAAAFAAMVRVLVIALPFQRDDWRPVIWVLAVASLAVGSLLAIVQTDVKRMLAYSSVSHAGFILVGLEAAGHDSFGDGTPAVANYLLLYAVLTIGSFAVVALVARSNGGDTSIDAFAGLARRRPLLAIGMTVFLLAQAGVPFTSGFIAKWGVIQAAVEEESYVIGIIAMIAAVVAAFMYLRIMVKTWLDAGDDSVPAEPVPFATGLSIAAAAGFTLLVGVFPGWLLDAADTVTRFAK